MPVSTNRRTSIRQLPTPLDDVIVIELLDTGERRPLPDKGQAHPDPNTWPDHKLVNAKPTQDGSREYELVYAADRKQQDLYNWEQNVAGLSGGPYDVVTRTYVTARSAYNSTTPTQGSTMPRDPENKFVEGFVLAQRQSSRLDADLDSLYIAETRVYVRRVTIYNNSYDELTGKNLTTTTEHFFRGEEVNGTPIETLVEDPTNAYWGLQSDGTLREARQLSENWYVVTTRQVIGGELVGGVLTVRTYSTNIDFYWPPVLDRLGSRQWERNDGSYKTYPDIDFDPEGYRGPMQGNGCRVVERDAADHPGSGADVTPLHPILFPLLLAQHPSMSA